MNKGWIDTSDKIQMFNEWAIAEGAVMPKIEYPAYFGDGLVGMRCTEDIEHREMFMAIPYKMLLSVKDTQAHPVLKQVLEENPELFAEESGLSWEQLTLVMRLFYEVIQGKEGHWYPYLR